MLKREGMGKARFMILLLIRFDDIDDTILLSSGFTELMALEGLQTVINYTVLLEKQVLRYLGEIDSQARGRKPFVTDKRLLAFRSWRSSPSTC
jgi:hypothetical protein